MKTLFKISTFTLFALNFVACGPQTTRVTEDGEGSDSLQALEVGTDMQEKEPLVLETRERTQQMLKAAREALNIEESTMEPENEGGESRKLILRYDSPGVPVVMEVSEPMENGKMSGLSVFYFFDKKLYAVDQPHAHYLFEGDKLKIWTNQDWVAVENVSSENWLDQENLLLEQVTTYLNEFGIEYGE